MKINMKKTLLVFMCLLIVALPLTLAGCTEFPGVVGGLEVYLEIPTDYPLTSLDEAKVTVTRDNESSIIKLPTTDNNLKFNFSHLEIGEWEIEAVVTDKDGYIIYSGNEVATVQANSSVPTNVHLDMDYGDLEVQVTTLDGLGITKGTVTLSYAGASYRYVADLAVSATKASFVFKDMPPQVYDVEIALYNNNGLFYESPTPKQVKPLPGRPTTALFQMSIQ